MLLYGSAYRNILKNNWIELFSHFFENKKPKNYWTYEKCKEISSSCKTNTELKCKCSSAYEKILKNNWSELMPKTMKIVKCNNYWTYEKCKEVALKCETKKELKSKYVSAHNKIYKENWLELLSHLKKIGNKYKRLIYTYEFSDNHCYVGLTGNIKRRNNQHIIGKDKSSVKKYMNETNLKPILKIKSDYIDVDLAILLEGETLNDYKNNGWILLNEVKTGGIGSHDLKWTIESCKIEVEKYEKLSDFIKYSGGAYTTILKKDWQHLLDPIRTKTIFRYWNNKELCEKESKKYNSRCEFRKSVWSAYNYSSINGWLDEFFPKYKKRGA